ncbi:MAG TPA: hypothetical protein VK436_15820 [Methanocella sp.]|nr:hypothetical protein [Methanocella sp.]
MIVLIKSKKLLMLAAVILAVILVSGCCCCCNSPDRKLFSPGKDKPGINVTYPKVVPTTVTVPVSLPQPPVKTHPTMVIVIRPNSTR